MMKKSLSGELLAEFIGTLILIFIGAGCVAGLVLSGATYSQWEISVIWGLGVTMAIYITGAVSGTHINPAVTIALMIYRDFPRRKVLPYIISQVAGAFSGAALVYTMYREAFIEFEQQTGILRGSMESIQTAGIFSTYPQSYLSNLQALFIEIVITAFLLMVIFAVTDERNVNAPKGKYAPFAALLIGLTIAIIGSSFGTLTGFAMNPARDFGPKLFTAIAGWGSVGIPGPNYYFWVPIVGPVIGGITGGFIYDFAIRKNIAEADDVVPEEIQQLSADEEKLRPILKEEN
ncbi:glycerol uptake facilitator protein [Tindallia magadiensis]|uniref:Glycerol uptake facilitator protein n=1 Tax=Tindallia magadiensis TaxID=69895 RepID=A0A1I3E564_9FIRM|nr:MIP/aquaporin family protein [Tindallia magadiensis]SFH93831.1 glycerol uptake facilitator protein [Tindallia magadiensis]